MGTIVNWYLFQVTFFEPVENDLKVLNLSSNIIEEVSPDDVGQLRRLRCIDISRSGYTVEVFLLKKSANAMQSDPASFKIIVTAHWSIF